MKISKLIFLFLIACTTKPVVEPPKITTNKLPQKLIWDIQFSKVNVGNDVQLIDLDLFDTSKEVIQKYNLRAVTICYFSAGSSEDWRPDYKDIPVSAIGKKMGEWKGENWLDVSNDKLVQIMKKRIDLAADKGCRGVDLDNVDGHTNNTGFNLQYDEVLTFNKLMATYARSKNLLIGLKNNLTQVKDLVDYYDFSIVESCNDYKECYYMEPFVKQKKPVLAIEYKTLNCDYEGFSAIKKNRELDDKVWRCK